MNFNDVIMFIMAVGVLLGGLDKILGNKIGLGKQFDEGFRTMGPIGLSIVGIITMAPVIASLLGPIVIPVYKFLGIDPAIFATILANDMGGYALATQLAENELIGLFAGTTIASMIGCTIVFAIPVGITLVKEEDYPYFFKGLMIGIIAMPVGSIVGGVYCGIPLVTMIINCLPILLLAVLMIVGLIFFQNFMIKAFTVFGRGVAIVSTIGLCAGAFEYITGIVLIKGLAPITDGTKVLIDIGLVLLGSYPIIYLIQKLLTKPFTWIGSKISMNTTSMMGLVVAMANSVPVFTMVKDMNPRGKVINTAWVVCAAAVFGAHLGFTAGVAKHMITALFIGKLTSGIIAVIIAFCLTKKE